MSRIPLFLPLFLALPAVSPAQQAVSERSLAAHEDTLRILSDTMILYHEADIREESCYRFIKMLVRALKTEGSYSWPFDSLTLISIQYAPDDAFRIFTWELLRQDGTYRYFGCIQMNSKDTLKLFPLFDSSGFLPAPEDSVMDHNKWYGAYYYNMILRKHWFKKHYYLFGWDRNDLVSNKKVLDVLTFEDGLPYFGADVFVYGEGDTARYKKRVILEYKKDASVTLNYSKDFKKILFDHLVPLNSLSREFKHTYVPDGTYCGFRYRHGKWYYIDMVEFRKTAPAIGTPEPVKDSE